MLKTLLIDHYDSFTWNVRAWLARHCDVHIVSYGDLEKISTQGYNLIVLSPGPKHPKDYPKTLQLLHKIDDDQAVLGICLGMQCMAYLSKNVIIPYEPPLHGKTSQINLKMCDGTLNQIQVARYHSLQCVINNDFEVLSTSEDRIPMIIKHHKKNWLGLQFHPESFLTESPDLITKFIKERLNL